jgi:hypothetical protein
MVRTRAQATAREPMRSGELQTFASESERARLTDAGVKSFRALAERWKLSNSEAADLLGVSGSTWDRIKRKAWDGTLSQDQLTRISALVGVFKGLHLLFADKMSDEWPRLPNKGPIFAHTTPIQAMIEGGIPRMLEVRRYVDAVRGGL